MIKNSRERRWLGAYYMSGAVAEKQAVSGIESIAFVLDNCHRQSVDSDKADDVEFFALLASETGIPVCELKELSRQKVCAYRDRLISILEKLKAKPSDDYLSELLMDVYQTSSSFYDNYGYLIQPDCVDEFLAFIKAIGLILDSLSDEFDIDDSLANSTATRKSPYNLKELISVVGK